MQILQVLFLQDLQDRALKMKLFLEDTKMLQKSCKKICKTDQILQGNLISLQFSLARFLQEKFNSF